MLCEVRTCDVLCDVLCDATRCDTMLREVPRAVAVARGVHCGAGMVSRAHDLECYQLANELRREVHAICAQDAVARCFRFCEGFSEAAGSVCRNMTEGFDRFESAAIVQFFGYALGSLGEVEDYLRESLTRNFIDQERFQRTMGLAEHARAKTLNFVRYHRKKVAAKSTGGAARRT